MPLPEKGYKRTAVITFYIIITVAVAYVFFKYIFSCTAPFLCAFALAYATRPAVLFLCRKYRFTRFAAVLTVSSAILGISTAVIWFLFSTAFSELSGLTVYLDNINISSAISETTDRLIELCNKFLPFLSEILVPRLEYFTKNIDALISYAISFILPYLGETAITVIGIFPRLMLFIGVTVLSFFYFGCDYDKITAFIKLQLSEKQLSFLRELKKQFLTTVLKTLKAYTVIIFLTFSELLVGFKILGIPYATVLSVIIALIDILPILGTGTVLIPWGILSLISGNSKTGLSILAIYVIITVIRQVAEPKILGDSVGLHPLLTLVTMYFGIKLAGIPGLFILPFIVIIIKNLNEKKVIRLYKNPEVQLTSAKPSRTERKL